MCVCRAVAAVPAEGMEVSIKVKAPPMTTASRLTVTSRMGSRYRSDSREISNQPRVFGDRRGRDRSKRMRRRATSSFQRRTPQTSPSPGTQLACTVTVTNIGDAPTTGLVTVTEKPPTGLKIATMSGGGWTCAVPTCTRSGALGPGARYPDITVTATVGSGVTSGVLKNLAVVSGGGEINDPDNTAEDPTIIGAPSAPGMDLTIRKKAQPGDPSYQDRRSRTSLPCRTWGARRRAAQ